ncbi:MAG: hypothetical protein K2I80_10680, partial [Ruminococcus sp.]|nr:hypothetical protein [Ruminococcus sp.]
ISFVVMTFLALLFFVKFPVTPSEKFTAGLGRASIYRQNNVESLTVTTATETSSVTTTVQTTDGTTTARTDFTITVTTGKGFRNNGHTLTISESSENDDILDSEETTQETTEDSENSDNSNYDDDYGMDY